MVPFTVPEKFTLTGLPLQTVLFDTVTFGIGLTTILKNFGSPVQFSIGVTIKVATIGEVPVFTAVKA